MNYIILASFILIGLIAAFLPYVRKSVQEKLIYLMLGLLIFGGGCAAINEMNIKFTWTLTLMSILMTVSTLYMGLVFAHLLSATQLARFLALEQKKQRILLALMGPAAIGFAICDYYFHNLAS